MPTRILIADDNEITRTLLTEQLNKHEGWKVCAAVENGEQAVAEATELRPDLVILDLAMPVMGGLRAAREIAKLPQSIPILIWTLHDASWLASEATKAGARCVVSKSDAGKLLTAIENLVPNEPRRSGELRS